MSGDVPKAESKRPLRVLDIRGLFNPVDCRSIGVIRDELTVLNPGELLEVLGNRFQHREVQAWCRKFAHPVVQIDDEDGLVRLWIEKRGRSADE